jgi:hypothetical protein
MRCRAIYPLIQAGTVYGAGEALDLEQDEADRLVALGAVRQVAELPETHEGALTSSAEPEPAKTPLAPSETRTPAAVGRRARRR